MTIIRLNYREEGEPRATMAEITELNGESMSISLDIMNYGHSGISGETYSATYHHNNGTTIVVKQTNITSVAEWKRGSSKAGWGSRRFLFGGEKSGVEQIVGALTKAGIKLKSEEKEK